KANSDEKRVEWCEEHLADYRFLYAVTSSSNPQKWKKCYQSPLVLQCFSVYFTAIKSSKWLLGMYPGSEDHATIAPQPRPALALAAAAAERALKLVAEGRITLETIRADKDNTGDLIEAGKNPQTGKRLIGKIAFSKDLWGQTVDDYLVSINSLKTCNLDAIIRATRAYSRVVDDLDDDKETIAFQPTLVERSSRARLQLGYNDDDSDGGNGGDRSDDDDDGGDRSDDDDGGDHSDDDNGGEASGRRALSVMEEESEKADDLLTHEQYDSYNNGQADYSYDSRYFEDGHAPDSFEDDRMDIDARAQHPSQDEYDDYSYGENT
ncbi:hypothetical protein FIBSPDRAFT_955240, partial [Athelia psychrophila]